MTTRHCRVALPGVVAALAYLQGGCAFIHRYEDVAIGVFGPTGEPVKGVQVGVSPSASKVNYPDGDREQTRRDGFASLRIPVDTHMTINFVEPGGKDGFKMAGRFTSPGSGEFTVGGGAEVASYEVTQPYRLTLRLAKPWREIVVEAEARRR